MTNVVFAKEENMYMKSKHILSVAIVAGLSVVLFGLSAPRSIEGQNISRAAPVSYVVSLEDGKKEFNVASEVDTFVCYEVLIDWSDLKRPMLSIQRGDHVVCAIPGGAKHLAFRHGINLGSGTVTISAPKACTPVITLVGRLE